MKSLPYSAPVRRGFSLVEVTLAIGILGIAILSLVGILGSTFQQVDDIMQTNRALAGVTRLIGALDNPRSIVYLTSAADSTVANAPTNYLTRGIPTLDPDSANPASNFDIAYRLLAGAKDNSSANAVWLYVYERKVVVASSDAQVSGTNIQYNIASNPSVMEVASCKGNNDNLTQQTTAFRNVVGTPMRVRLSLSKLLVGQRFKLDAGTAGATGEPTTTDKWAVGSTLPVDPRQYALAYLPVVAEFFPHDYADSTIFKSREEAPVLVQNIIISR
jgi:prepilin-type N-terminal cleavage/methylation domain-containing protein